MQVRLQGPLCVEENEVRLRQETQLARLKAVETVLLCYCYRDYTRGLGPNRVGV